MPSGNQRRKAIANRIEGFSKLIGSIRPRLRNKVDSHNDSGNDDVTNPSSVEQQLLGAVLANSVQDVQELLQKYDIDPNLVTFGLAVHESLSQASRLEQWRQTSSNPPGDASADPSHLSDVDENDEFSNGDEVEEKYEEQAPPSSHPICPISDDYVNTMDQVFLWKKLLGEGPTLMHMAVLNLYHYHPEEHSTQEMERALEILELLLCQSQKDDGNSEQGQSTGTTVPDTDNEREGHSQTWNILLQPPLIIETNPLDLAMAIQQKASTITVRTETTTATTTTSAAEAETDSTVSSQNVDETDLEKGDDHLQQQEKTVILNRAVETLQQLYSTPCNKDHPIPIELVSTIIKEPHWNFFHRRQSKMTSTRRRLLLSRSREQQQQQHEEERENAWKVSIVTVPVVSIADVQDDEDGSNDDNGSLDNENEKHNGGTEAMQPCDADFNNDKSKEEEVVIDS